MVAPIAARAACCEGSRTRPPLPAEEARVAAEARARAGARGRARLARLAGRRGYPYPADRASPIEGLHTSCDRGLPARPSLESGGSSLQRNLAARAGRWSAKHRKLAVFGWLAFVIAALAIGSATGQRSLTTAE